MEANASLNQFLSTYDELVFKNALILRNVLFENLPNIKEQIDLPAKMVAYCYGQKYSDLICTIIPSKKGLKLGFNRGTELNDIDKVLEGNGKISRYVEIKSGAQIQSNCIKNLIENALILYNEKSSGL